MIVAGFKFFSDVDYSYIDSGYVDVIETMIDRGHVFSSMVVKR